MNRNFQGNTVGRPSSVVGGVNNTSESAGDQHLRATIKGHCCGLVSRMTRSRVHLQQPIQTFGILPSGIPLFWFFLSFLLLGLLQGVVVTYWLFCTYTTTSNNTHDIDRRTCCSYTYSIHARTILYDNVQRDSITLLSSTNISSMANTRDQTKRKGAKMAQNQTHTQARSGIRTSDL